MSHTIGLQGKKIDILWKNQATIGALEVYCMKSCVYFFCQSGEWGVPQLLWDLSELLCWSVGQPLSDLLQRTDFLMVTTPPTSSP